MRGIGGLMGVAWRDLLQGLAAWQLWSKFAWYDMLARYRRSWVGPVWLILTTLIFVAALSGVYSSLFQVELSEYVPFIAVGVVVWGFISAVTNEGVTTFVESETFIRQIRLNHYVYVLRVICRNVFVFAHQLVAVVLVLLIFGKFAFLMLPLAFVGICLLLLQALWVTPLLGLAGARFRDSHPIVTNMLQVLFFVTPVLWSPSALGARRWIADINPLSSLIAVVREPLLGSVPTLHDYTVVLLVTVVGSAITLIVYGRFNLRIVYWL